MTLETFMSSAAVVALATAYTMLGSGIVSIVAEYVVGDSFHALSDIAKRRFILAITLFLATSSYFLSCNGLAFVSCDTNGVLTIAAAVFVALLGGAAVSTGIHQLTKKAG